MAATVDERGNFYADQEVIVLAPSSISRFPN